MTLEEIGNLACARARAASNAMLEGEPEGANRAVQYFGALSGSACCPAGMDRISEVLTVGKGCWCPSS